MDGELVRCPTCQSARSVIKGAMQGLNENDKSLSVDIYYKCQNGHEWCATFYSENGTQWTKTKGEE